MDKNVIAAVQGFGFDVYMRKPGDSWLIFTDGKNLGYLQENRLEPVTLSTVHKPNRATGTGFRVERTSRDITREDLLSAFAVAPEWALGRGVATVEKWRDMAAFLSADNFNRGYSLVPAG